MADNKHEHEDTNEDGEEPVDFGGGALHPPRLSREFSFEDWNFKEYQTQMRQAFLVVIFQLGGAGLCLLIFWNYKMIKSYVSPMFWAVVWSTVLHSTKKSIVFTLINLDEEVDEQCKDWTESYRILQFLVRVVKLPRVIASQFIGFLKGPSSSNVIANLFGRIRSFKTALFVVFVATATSFLSSRSLLSWDPDFSALLNSVAVLSALLVALLVYVMILLPKHSYSFYNNCVTTLLVVALIVGVGLTVSVLFLKVAEEGTVAVDIATEIFESNKKEVTQLLEDLNIKEHVHELLEMDAVKQAKETLFQYAGGGNFVQAAYDGDLACEGSDCKETTVSILDLIYGTQILSETNETIGGIAEGRAPVAAVGLYERLESIFSSLSWSSVTDSVTTEQLTAIWEYIKTTLARLIGVGTNVSAILLSMTNFVLESGIYLISFGLDFMVFLACLYYLLKNDDSPLQLTTSFLPITSSNQNFIREHIITSIKGIFQATFLVFVIHGFVTWFTFVIFGLNFPFIAGFISAFTSVVPLIPSWIIGLPPAIRLIIAGSVFEGLTVITVHVCLMFVDTGVYQYIPNSHAYITGLSIVMGLGTFGLNGAVLGPMLICVTSTFFKIWTAFMPRRAPGKR